MDSKSAAHYVEPPPVIEPGRAYVTFGSPGTACLDTPSGKVLWERRDIECNHYRGAGSSPIIYKDLLIMHYDGSDHQFVLALDKQTGEETWRTPREEKSNWGSPLLWKNKARTEVVTVGGALQHPEEEPVRSP